MKHTWPIILISMMAVTTNAGEVQTDEKKEAPISTQWVLDAVGPTGRAAVDSVYMIVCPKTSSKDMVGELEAWKEFDLEPGTPRVGLDVREAHAQIEKQGFYVNQAKITTTIYDSAGGVVETKEHPKT